MKVLLTMLRRYGMINPWQTYKGTIIRLLEQVGTACADYQDRVIQNVSAKRVQVDEIWSFVGAEAKNTKPEHFESGRYAGHAWTFVAIDADSKLVIGGLRAGGMPGMLRTSFRM